MWEGWSGELGSLVIDTVSTAAVMKDQAWLSNDLECGVTVYVTALHTAIHLQTLSKNQKKICCNRYHDWHVNPVRPPFPTAVQKGHSMLSWYLSKTSGKQRNLRSRLPVIRPRIEQTVVGTVTGLWTHIRGLSLISYQTSSEDNQASYLMDTRGSI
jgi:hypothetical protein